MVYLWAVLLYLGFLIGVSIYVSRRVATSADFMVAGRKLSTPVLVGTLLSTWIGSGSIIASAGLAYRRGFPALWFSAGVWLAFAVIYFIAGRARALGQYTVPDLLEIRYNATARVLAALVTVVAYTALVSYQFRAGGFVLNVVAGVPQETGIIITAIFVIGYTAIAGLMSVAATDIFNGTLMAGAVFVAYPLLLGRAGGWEAIRSSLASRGLADHFSLLGSLSLKEAFALTLPGLLLLLGLANMYQRFFSARDPRTARRAVVGWLVGTIFMEGMIVVLAVIGSSLFPELSSGGQDRSEIVLLHAARHGLPVAAGCVLLAATVAIIVSTADSFLLVPATNVVRDIYQRFFHRGVREKTLVLCSRLAVVGLGALAYLQLHFHEKVLEAALYAYTMYGVGITPALLAAFLWRRATPAGGVASIASGMVVTLVWELAGKPLGWPTVYPALAASLAALLGVSWLSPPPPAEKWKPFLVSG